MGNRRKLFIHPGYPKTASTTLQKRLFSRHPDLCYLGKPLTGNLLDIETRILGLDAEQFTAALPELRNRFVSVLEQRVTDGCNVLLSHEGFLRPTRYQGHDIRTTAERLRQVFRDPVQDAYDVQVLLTIRKQTDIIPSYFFDSASRSPERFRKFIVASLQAPDEGYFASLFYDALVQHYAALFGRERIKVMLFEEFIDRREDFLRELAEYLEIDAMTCLELAGGRAFNIKQRQGTGYRITANEYLLDLLNRCGLERERLPRLLRLPLKRIPLKHRVFALSTTEQTRIRQLYAASNRRLSAEFGLGLDQYGYFQDVS